jgi:hypothetical protein
MAVSTGDDGENRSVYRLRWLGYGLLVFALIDAVNIVASINTGDPTWILQVIGQFVERVVVPLLGFALIFFGEIYARKDGERIGLMILSWLCLVLAIAFFLMIPPLVIQSVSLQGQAEQRVTQQVDQQVKAGFEQLDQLEAQLKNSKPEELKALAAQLNSRGIQVDAQDPAALKTQIQERIKTIKDQAQVQAQKAKETAKQGASGQVANLFKNAVKWSLGAAMAGVLFIYLWRSSGWARSLQ